MSLISYIKLIRIDTTLDLNQMVEKGLLQTSLTLSSQETILIGCCPFSQATHIQKNNFFSK